MSTQRRLALVTGGGSGIGKSVCEVLARANAVVVVAGRTLQPLNETVSSLRGDGHVAVRVDVGDPDSVAALFEAITNIPMKLSIVVHCAAIMTSVLVKELGEDVFDEVTRVNLKGTFLINQAAVRAMLRGRVTDGVIVNVSSIVAKTGFGGFSAYSASKAGVVAFTKSLAQELDGKGIRVNAVLPGITGTRWACCLSQTEKQDVVRMTPLQRVARPEEVAKAIEFICSSASSYVTGTAIEVAGGLHS